MTPAEPATTSPFQPASAMSMASAMRTPAAMSHGARERINASAPGIVEQAVRCSRPGSRILLFAQTSHQERIEISGADVCMGERTVFGCYSASVDLQKEAADLVFSGALPVEDLVTHRFPLDEIRSGIQLALHPEPESLKIIVQPQRWT